MVCPRLLLFTLLINQLAFAHVVVVVLRGHPEPLVPPEVAGVGRVRGQLRPLVRVRLGGQAHAEHAAGAEREATF